MDFIDFHVEYFPENLGDYSEKQGKRFPQDIKSNATMLSKKMGWKYDGWLLLDVEKRCTSESKYKKKNALQRCLSNAKEFVIMRKIAVLFHTAVED